MLRLVIYSLQFGPLWRNSESSVPLIEPAMRCSTARYDRNSAASWPPLVPCA